MKMRRTKLFSLVCFAVIPVFAAHADSVSTGGAAGTYTYTIDLGGGASFVMVSDGAFGTPGANNLSYAYSGSPAVGYTSDPNILFSGNTTSDGVVEQELVLQYDSTTTGYSNTLDYTFAEPTSFWENLGAQSFTTGDGESIYDVEGWTGPDTAGQFFGTVPEGANYTYYADGVAADDPPCTACTITTTFVPAPSVTPEPSSLVLLGTGILGIAGTLRRRRFSAQS